MQHLRISVKTNWLNGWFIRVFSRPYIVIDGVEHLVKFSTPKCFSSNANSITIGAGIRYFGRGQLLGYEAETFILDPQPNGTIEIILRNGFWNHSPFRIINNAI